MHARDMKSLHLQWQECDGNVWLQEVLGEENADQVAVNFFGDGTCNVGESPLPQPCIGSSALTWRLRV